MRASLARVAPPYTIHALRAILLQSWYRFNVRSDFFMAAWLSDPAVPDRVRTMLTSDRVSQAFLEIERMRLSATLRSLVDEYRDVVAQLNESVDGTKRLPIRNPALWKWGKFHVGNIVHRFRGATYDNVLDDAVAEIKVMLILFNVLIDDVAEVLHHRAAFEALAEIPHASSVFPGPTMGRQQLIPPAFAGYFEFAESVWRRAMTSVKALFPRGWALLAPDLAEDYRLVMSSIRFSLDVNVDPIATLALSVSELERRYGSPSIDTILSHNMNSVAFHSIDRIALCESSPACYTALEESAALTAQRELLLVSQDMHSLANAIATATREIETGDVSNQIFKVASDSLDALIPAEKTVRAVAEQLGRPLEPNFFLLALKNGDGGGAKTQALRRLFRLSGAQQSFFNRWLKCEIERDAILARLALFLDAERVRASDELLLATHLMYTGRV